MDKVVRPTMDLEICTSNNYRVTLPRLTRKFLPRIHIVYNQRTMDETETSGHESAHSSISVMIQNFSATLNTVDHLFLKADTRVDGKSSDSRAGNTDMHSA